MSQCVDLATQADKNRFVIPQLTPDEIDDFVTFILKSGYSTDQIRTASDGFRKYVFTAWKSTYKPKKKRNFNT